eukprot:XP_001703980.1 Protein 21.1 [Giardia lamblia ATCC 50803]
MQAREGQVMQLSGAVATITLQPEAHLLPRLIRAAHTNDTETVRVLLEEGVRTGQRDKQKMTALMHAAQQGHGGPVELLVKKEKGLRDKTGWTALMIAAEKGSLEVVKLLLEHEKGMKDKDGNTAFVHALRNKHTDIALLLQGYETHSWTPLMRAALTGDTKTVRKHFLDKDTRNDNGDTALIIAARAGHRNIVELLDPTNENGVTALMRAVDRNDVDTVKALLPLQGGQKATGNVEIGRWFICKGTALMRAAAHGHTRIVELLVEKEGGMQNSNGRTALMTAAGKGHTKIVEILLEKEAGMKDSDGWTALRCAAQNGKQDCVKLLLEKEGGMRDRNGKTALMIAAEKGHPECIKLLLEKEGGMQTSGGETALMFAVYNNQIECMQFLAEKEKNINRNQLLGIAKQRGSNEMMALLLE